MSVLLSLTGAGLGLSNGILKNESTKEPIQELLESVEEEFVGVAKF